MCRLRQRPGQWECSSHNCEILRVSVATAKTKPPRRSNKNVARKQWKVLLQPGDNLLIEGSPHFTPLLFDDPSFLCGKRTLVISPGILDVSVPQGEDLSLPCFAHHAFFSKFGWFFFLRCHQTIAKQSSNIFFAKYDIVANLSVNILWTSGIFLIFRVRIVNFKKYCDGKSSKMTEEQGSICEGKLISCILFQGKIIESRRYKKQTSLHTCV